MHPEKQPIDTTSLLDDIYHVNQVNKHEIELINNRLQQLATESENPGQTTDAIIKELSSRLGKLTARVNLTEKAIQSIKPVQVDSLQHTETTSEQKSRPTELKIGATQLSGNNLLPVEHSDNGISYTWSTFNPETKFTFDLDRSNPLEMQIRVFSVIKSEYLKQLKIFVDEIPAKHRIKVDKPLFVMRCDLPPSSQKTKTEVRIVLPGTHSPMDLGISKDPRTLGIAISEIRFGKTGGSFRGLFKRANR